jgi:hypothetical protein
VNTRARSRRENQSILRLLHPLTRSPCHPVIFKRDISGHSGTSLRNRRRAAPPRPSTHSAPEKRRWNVKEPRGCRVRQTAIGASGAGSHYISAQDALPPKNACFSSDSPLPSAGPGVRGENFLSVGGRRLNATAEPRRTQRRTRRILDGFGRPRKVRYQEKLDVTFFLSGSDGHAMETTKISKTVN